MKSLQPNYKITNEDEIKMLLQYIPMNHLMNKRIFSNIKRRMFALKFLIIIYFKNKSDDNLSISLTDFIITSAPDISRFDSYIILSFL